MITKSNNDLFSLTYSFPLSLWMRIHHFSSFYSTMHCALMSPTHAHPPLKAPSGYCVVSLLAPTVLNGGERHCRKPLPHPVSSRSIAAQVHRSPGPSRPGPSRPGPSRFWPSPVLPPTSFCLKRERTI